MSNKAPKIDSGSWLMLLVSLVAILLTVYVLITSLISTIEKNSTKGELENTLIASAANNLKPIGTSATSDTAAVASTPVATRSGKEVYTTVCAACHATGVANAPKLDDKAAWEPRVATGLDALMATAINGKGAMPPRAGRNIGDEELKATILYMTKEAGFDLGGATPATEQKPAATEEPVAEKKKETTETAPATTTDVPAPKPATETMAEAVPVPATTSGDGAALYTAKGCNACHGADARTPIMPLYPKVAGQSKVYVMTQMQDIKSGKRSNGQSVVMKGVMAGVSDTEIAAIADYLSGL